MHSTSCVQEKQISDFGALVSCWDCPEASGRLAALIADCTPCAWVAPEAGEEHSWEWLLDPVQAAVGSPVTIVSSGPAFTDKLIREGPAGNWAGCAANEETLAAAESAPMDDLAGSLALPCLLPVVGVVGR